MKKDDKVLVVIPAYNEEKNIEKVINDVKKNIKFADILIINDKSKDNTLNIIKKCDVNYVDNVFNLKYALSIQTGIKYAKENDYDYVIQMDADGQHLAIEAEKLYQTAKKEKSDIVIGSRYLVDLGYPCPFFRRVGTKAFEILIRLFCHKKIVDPLSGFQCINKRVIDRYSKLGGYPEFPDANLVIDMLLSGYTIKEVPTKMKVRTDGESMHSGIIKPIKYMCVMFYTCIIVLIKNIGKRKEN
ncbi:MAG: glycosyltransferase family 2 protein [Bacilli bacterium]|nr:glycosyltransferase family 2 protein [Bacilli bacterium]